MGAELTEQTASGRTVDEAYRRAVEAATAEYGHRDGYSGAINSKATGYCFFELPPRLTFRKLLGLIFEYEDAEGELEGARSDLDYYVENGKPRRGYAKQVARARTQAKRAKAKIERIEGRYPSLDIEQIVRQQSDKWEAPVAVELRGAELKRYRERHQVRRGERVYVFFGYAPS